VTRKTKTLLQILHEISRSYQLQLTRDFQTAAANPRPDAPVAGQHPQICRYQSNSKKTSTNSFSLQPQSALLHSIVNGRYLRHEDRDMVEDLERKRASRAHQVACARLQMCAKPAMPLPPTT